MADEKDDLLAEALEEFDRAQDAESDNRKTYLDDVRFARDSDQWDERIRKQREDEARPCLTINKTMAFVRQVVNDARQNKPSIKVHPVDSAADPETAQIINGLIRNIEYTSHADVAYDTGVECAVVGGWGYWRIRLDYAYDDTFEQDILIDRIANPLSVYGDPNSTAADSCDWNTAFIVDRLTHDEYRAKYKGAEKVNWSDAAWQNAGSPWFDADTVMVAEWWKRHEIERKAVQLSTGEVTGLDDFERRLKEDQDFAVAFAEGIVSVNGERLVKSHKVVQRIMSGAEVLKTNDWLGRYIPIVPVYGDEFDIEGKRYLRSLIHSARDAQSMFNYWRTAATELVALAPKVPYIGRKGAFDTDIARWSTANTQSHPYLEYDGNEAPIRQPLDTGVAAGALQEALNASDDMKAIMGLYDASLGARSNETSGRAIMARQREGDVATFHFSDNQVRAIRHTGRILIDLIPKVYTQARVVRVLGEDGTPKQQPVNQPAPVTDKDGKPVMDPNGQPMMKIYDLTAGKYDLTVTAGPSFTTRRQEAAAEMTELVRSFPDAAPVIGDLLAKNLDWPGADEIAERLKKLVPGQEPQIPPELQQAMEEGKKRISQLEQENQQLKMEKANKENEIASNERIAMIEIESEERIAKAKEESAMRVAAYKAELQARATLATAENRPAQQPAR